MAGDVCELNFIPAAPDMPGFDALRQESEREGFAMLARLQDEWENGANVFSAPGEMLLEAEAAGALVGIAGLNADPHAGRVRQGRVRRLHAIPGFHREGIGKALIGSLLRDAGMAFDTANVRAPEEAADFYERLGFVGSAEDEHQTHSRRLHSGSEGQR